VGRSKLLQNSTVGDITGTWWRAELTKDDLRWARLNLVEDKLGQIPLQRQAGFRFIEKPPSRQYFIPKTWEERVVYCEGEQHPRVLVQLRERYQLGNVYELARAHRDPELAPHVAFRRLVPGNSASALGFLEQFGPLELDDMEPRPVVWVDLNRFWRLHARYCAIVKLYESVNDHTTLIDALLDILDHLPELNSSGPAELGLIPNTHRDIPYIRTASIHDREFYLALSGRSDSSTSLTLLQYEAKELILSELILQIERGIAPTWLPEDDLHSIAFRPARAVLSLWGGIWELFGLDTWTGFGLRVCRICGKHFYPLQRNSECCSPDHQALWSKRRYARTQREAKKLRSSLGSEQLPEEDIEGE
jgi:hypothetical protein